MRTAPLAFASSLAPTGRSTCAAATTSSRPSPDKATFDVAFEITGTAAGLASAIASVRRGGTLVQVGNLPGGQIPIPANAIMAKELDLKGTFRFGAEFNEAVDLIASGDVDVLKLVTAERPLSSAPDAFPGADRSQSVKVVLTAD